MGSIKLTSSVSLLAIAAVLGGCGIGDALSGTASAAKLIEDGSEAKIGVKMTSVTCEEAPEDAKFDFTCEGKSEYGPIRFQVEKSNNIFTYTPVNLFTEAEAAGLETDIIANLQVSELDCGGDAPYYVPIESMSIVCTGTSVEGEATEITVTVDEANLQYTYEITG